MDWIKLCNFITKDMFDEKIKRKGDRLVSKNCKILVMMNKTESFDIIARKAKYMAIFVYSRIIFVCPKFLLGQLFIIHMGRGNF